MQDRVNHAPGIPVDANARRAALSPMLPGLPGLPGWRAGLREHLHSWPWLPWRPRCQGCGERCHGERDLCPACEAALPRIHAACATCGLPMPSPAMAAMAAGADPRHAAHARCAECRRAPPPLDRVVVPFLYASPLDRWVPRFKFHHDLAAGRLLSQLMLEACATAPRPDALVPVPLHRARLRRRGYDQALELAKPLARALALPLRTDLLRRVRATSAQSSLHAGERHRNLQGAFALARRAHRHPLPTHVALIDDVMTTGATLHAAAHALRAAGVARVDAWACARTP